MNQGWFYALAFVLVGFTPAAGEPPQVAWRVDNRTSNRFRQELSQVRRTIPEKVWQRLVRAGWSIQVSRFVTDVDPDLKQQRPRGWPKTLTWQNSDALHDLKKRLLVIAELRVDHQGRVVSCTRAAGVFRHEVGHAFDVVAAPEGVGFVSASRRFVAAYDQDVQRIRQAESKRLRYYLQNKDAGRQEAFAESFAVLTGGGCNVSEEASFRTAFPNTLAFVARQIEDFRER